jgi:hypothetical protein
MSPEFICKHKSGGNRGTGERKPGGDGSRIADRKVERGGNIRNRKKID